MRVASEMACRVLISAILASPAVPQAIAVAQESPSQTVTHLEDVWSAADCKHDGATVGRLLAEDFTFVGPNGEILSKTQVVEGINSNREHCVRATHSELKPRVYGNTVVLTGVWAVTLETGPGTVENGYRWTDTWVRDADGQWLCVASQSNHFAHGPAR